MYKRISLVGVVLLFSSLISRADSLVLDSSANGTYSYGLVLAPFENAVFPNGTGITLSGVSGVTGVTLSFSANCFTTMITPSSVVLTQTTNQVACSFLNPSQDSVEFSNLFALQSTVLTSGPISYALNGLPTTSGLVAGPVRSSITPEPSTFALLGSGLLGMAGLVKRRLA